MSQVSHFQGAIANDLLRRAKAPVAYRALGRVISHQEGQGGGPVTKFAQDTGVGWLPKLVVSRTLVEGLEVSFLEFMESAMAYFLPFWGGPKLARLFHAAAGGQARLDRKLLTRPVEKLSKAEAARAVPVKAAVIIATIGAIGLLGESLVNYGKNLLTAHFFQKDRFIDVVNLRQGQMRGDARNSPQVRKSRNRIAQVLMAFGGLMAGSLALARFGHRLPKGMQTLLHSGVKRFDFDFSKGSRYSIGRGLLGAIMLTSMFPYLDSARDRYERLETLCRLPVVFLYILFGQELLQKGMLKTMPGLFRGILKKESQSAQKQVMSLSEIAQDALQKAAAQHHLPLSAKELQLDRLSDAILKTAARNMQAPLRAKALHVAAPLGVGILGTGFGLGLLNRFLTAYRYQCQQQQPLQSSPVSLAPMAFRPTPLPVPVQRPAQFPARFQ